jgi:BA14K-like protein
MRRTIETAPRDGQAIILEDDAKGTSDVAHWSPEAGEWIGEHGEPSKITPSHWYPLQGDNYLQQGLDISSGSSQAGPSTSRARRYSFFFPFSLRRAAPQRPTASPAVEPQTAPVEAKRAPHARRRFATSSIAATLVAAALIGVYFRAEVADYVMGYADQQDSINTSVGQVFEQETLRPSQGSRKADLLPLRQQAEADQARAQAGAHVKQAGEASAPETRQSLEKEQRTEVLANELAEARRAINRLNLQLRAAVANSAQLLGQERQDAIAARQELAASTVQYRLALEEERARSAALASELAKTRGQIETQAALSSKTSDEAAQHPKQATESATPGLQQSLQQEHDRAESLASELAKARRDVETQVALSSKTSDEAAQFKQAAENATAELRQFQQHEHDRAEALASELAKARSQIETEVALSSKTSDEAAQLKQAAESATAELRQSLQQEHDRAESLATELAKARADNEAQVALSSKTGDEAARLKQADESATAALRQSLQQEHDRAESLASELAIARRDVETQVALSSKTSDKAAHLKQDAESAMAELRQRGQAVEQKPAAVEERPSVSLPAWANSDASVKPAQTAKQSEGVAPENSNPAIKPVGAVPLPRERAMSADNGYCSQRYRSYDPASGTYTGYDGRRHSCR